MNFKHKDPSHVFTTKSIGISRMLALDIEITPFSNPARRFKTKGIWDTGATGSVITQEVADVLGIKPIGKANVNTVGISDFTTDRYMVDIFLKADVRVQGAEVTVGKIASDMGFHCLIGMDIITLGDFSITNFEGNTCLSFRLPSRHQIDYVLQMNRELDIVKQHFNSGKNVNTPCSCGSGKKFKNCHGRDWETGGVPKIVLRNYRKLRCIEDFRGAQSRGN
ncbi:MAG: SEC-C metal-binding domain-containing protein [Puia sp.]|nr:SEC-C metal-binding domain-containing protein [Puia sp.]